MKPVMSRSVVIAVDPGASGSIAIHADGKLLGCYPMGTDEETCALIRQMALAPACLAYMEQVGGYIGKEQPGSAMFNFGNGYGFIRGAFKMAQVHCALIPPQKWMRAVAPGVIGMDRDRRKRALLELANHWWPEAGLAEMSKTQGLIRADALCILHYALGREAAGADPVAKAGRSRAQWPADVKGFKKWCKANQLPVPHGTEFYTAVNWWTEKGRPEK